MGAVGLTGNPKYHEGFGPPLGGVTHVAYGDAAAVRAAMGPDVAGIVVEPVQGEGGVMPAPAGFLAELRRLADEHGALLLIDEVQTGMGRTGKMFAHQHSGIEPDAMSLAKGIAGGLPLGALLAREEIAKVFTPGTHASTFGGNPVSTAAASAVVDLLDGGLLGQAREMGDRLAHRLAGIARESRRAEGERGLGLLRALLLAEDLAPKVVAKARDLGLLVNAIGDRVLRLAPPLTVSAAEIDDASRVLSQALAHA
jgi:acetylornithine/N-succinyldiaminopimelate aminotransferase